MPRRWYWSLAFVAVATTLLAATVVAIAIATTRLFPVAADLL
jgi:hypothetical protein